MMRSILPVLAAALLCAPAAAQPPLHLPPQAVQGVAILRLRAILQDYDRFDRDTDPVQASADGDRQALSRLPDVSAAALAAQRTALQAFRTRLAAVPLSVLPPEDALNRDLLARTIDDQLESLAFDEARMPFNTYEGFNGLADELSRTPIASRADADAWIARLRAFPRYYADNIANARRGVATGFVLPKVSAVLVLDAARKQAATPAADGPYTAPFKSLPATIPHSDQAALRARALAIVTDLIKPQQQAFVTFLETEYLPHARDTLAARALPDGDAYYAYLVRHHTTTDMTPDQIHALGLREVGRIRGEMTSVIASSGFKGSFAQFQAFLHTDPQFYATSTDELLDKYARMAKRIDDKLPHWFATLPRLPFAVRPIPAETAESSTPAYYEQGSPAQGIAGGYMINLTHLDQRPFYEMPALTLHEAEPGHHLQIALAQELTGVPRFRRNAYITAFVEGWALYSEQLGDEMGVYQTPYEEFGRLSFEMWRACRLVADTGIHWLGWTREQARACFAENTALAPKTIENELDRYISWPAQALAYKLGELKLMQIRRQAEASLGPRFDPRRFHDALLSAGPLPLDVLQRRMDGWIAGEQGAAATER